MNERTATHEALPTPVCRRCGQPIPPLAMVCRDCGEMLITTRLLRWERNHTADIVIAGVLFLVTNLIVIVLSNAEVFTLPSMLLRLVVFGVPCLSVLWKWYRLMHVIDPDYGLLWEMYWTMQLLVWVGLVLMFLLLSIVIFLSMLVFTAGDSHRK